jgi:predicted RNase H-like HicB family nuclease
LQEIDGLSATENLERQKLINELLQEHASIKESFNDLSVENKNLLKEAMKTFTKYGDILTNLLNELIAHIKLSENVEKSEGEGESESGSNIEEALDFVLNNLSEINETLPLVEQIRQVESNIKLIVDFETNYNQDNKDSLNYESPLQR